MYLDKLAGAALCGFVQLITGARVVWQDNAPEVRQRVYFANHRSHADAVLLWSALPARVRFETRPVAGADYWLTNKVKRYIAERIFRCVLIDRVHAADAPNPIAQMVSALDAGDSLIIFPEGTRNLDDGVKPFKAGLYYLAAVHPEVEFVPVWLQNMGRVMPKGAVVPVPLICTLFFGPPIRFEPGEGKAAFLDRARNALLSLEPAKDED